MYSINLGLLKFSFKCAPISVPSNGDHYGWTCDSWIDIPQQIEILQYDITATVITHSGDDDVFDEHTIKMLEPSITTEHHFIEYILRIHLLEDSERDDLLSAISCKDYVWGKLLALNWSYLGYAPGGIQYWILIAEVGTISVGLLRLDWDTVEIVHTSDL